MRLPGTGRAIVASRELHDLLRERVQPFGACSVIRKLSQIQV